MTVSSREKDSREMGSPQGAVHMCAWLFSGTGLYIHAQSCTCGLDVFICPHTCDRASACSSMFTCGPCTYVYKVMLEAG